MIPANETFCEAEVNVSRTSGRGYSPIQYYVAKEDGSFSVHGGYLYTFWDMNPPTIDNVSVDKTLGQMTVRDIDNDRVNNWQLR
ncbi:hypothetical protein, partial [Vibrio parahaemolyticus]|uniref:hypothetical protein n=1 Tax=Vibrio parahaemolyticus TaxID=670 RepID=UPI001A8CD743